MAVLHCHCMVSIKVFIILILRNFAAPCLFDVDKNDDDDDDHDDNDDDLEKYNNVVGSGGFLLFLLFLLMFSIMMMLWWQLLRCSLLGSILTPHSSTGLIVVELE